MYRQECYKLFSKKSIYVLLFLIILMLYYANILLPDETMKGEVYEELYQIWGGPVTEQKLADVRQQMRESDAGTGEQSLILEPTLERRAQGEAYHLVAVSGLYVDDLRQRQEILQGTLEKANDNTYQYRVAAKELQMLEQLDERNGFYLIRAWQGMLNFIEPMPGVLFLSALILLGLAPVFAEEYSKRTASLILATKHGRRRIVSAKIMASVTYIVVILFSLHIVNICLQWIKHGGFAGWDAPIQGLHIFHWYYGASPYAWEMWQLYLVVLAVQLLACLALGMLILLLSMITRNAMLTFFIGGALMIVPLFLSDFIDIERSYVMGQLNNFSLIELMKVRGLFEQFKAYNLLGYPVLYPQLLFLLYVVVTALMVWFTYYRFRHQQISN